MKHKRMRRKSMQYCFSLYSSVNGFDNVSSLPPVSLLNYICARCGRGNPSPTEICVRLRLSNVGAFCERPRVVVGAAPYVNNTIIHNTIKPVGAQTKIAFSFGEGAEHLRGGRGRIQKDLITSSVGYADTFSKGEGYFSYCYFLNYY